MPKKIDPAEAAQDIIIRQVAAKNPGCKYAEIGRKLQTIGIVVDPETIRKAIKRKPALKKDLNEIKQAHLRQLHEEILPKALDIHQKVLNSPKIKKEKKYNWVKLAEDKAWGEVNTPILPPTINIGQIQAVIQQSLGVTGVTNNDNNGNNCAGANANGELISGSNSDEIISD